MQKYYHDGTIKPDGKMIDESNNSHSQNIILVYDLHMSHENHRETGGTLGMVPLIINPIYTLYSGYLFGISLLKGSNRGVQTARNS